MTTRTSEDMPRVVLFYKYFVPCTPLLNRYPEHYVQALYNHQLDLCTRLNLKGRVLLALEGINGTVCAPDEHILQEYITAMVSFDLAKDCLRPGEGEDNGNAVNTADGSQLVYSDIDWKQSACSVSEPFPDLKISIVKEIVSTGGVVCAQDIPRLGGKHLTPREFHNVLSNEKDVVLIDVRNTFEHEIGHFMNPKSREPAINPNMVAFSNFDSTFCARHAESLKDKKVLMYCTGGIRCEKASAMLRKRGVEDVSQLKGGIHRYLEEFGDTDDSHFHGKNFVFDQRVSALDSTTSATTVVGKCAECGTPYDEISGSRLCTVCRDLVLVCPACQGRLREYHCRRHSNWKHCYFTFLEIFDEDAIQEQKRQLEDIRESLLSIPGAHKKVRRTLMRQITKIDKRLKDLESGEAKVDRNAPRRCRTCMKTNDECDGRCWGFWRHADASIDLGKRKSCEREEGDAGCRQYNLSS